MANRSRINWIDWAKSTSMFLVVLGHCHIQSSYQLTTQVIYSFHIPLFFYLSGLLSPKNFSKSSLLKDCKYIIAPYFVFGTLLIITHSLLSGDFSFSFYYTNIGSLFVGDDACIGAIWFLPALFICKQLYFLYQRIGRGSIITHALLFTLSLFPAYYISSNNINLPLFADSALFGLPFFLIGSKSLTIIEGKVNKNIPIIIGAIVSFTLTIQLSNFIVILFMLNLYIMQTRSVVDMFNHSYGLYDDVWSAWAEGIINITVTIIIASKYGIIGILLGKIISLFVIVVLWKPYYLYSKGFKDSITDYWKGISIYHLSFAMAIAYIIITTNMFKNHPLSTLPSMLSYTITEVIPSIIIFLVLLILFGRGTKDLIKRIPIINKFKKHAF